MAVLMHLQHRKRGNMRGQIIQNLSGLYQVMTTEQEVFRCRARGIFRKNKITLSAGDFVEFDALGGLEGIITAILPRKNEFIRPNVTNVDALCYVISSRVPQPDPFLIDKMTVLAALKNVEIILILNKLDLDDDHSAQELLNHYQELGFTVLYCTATHMTQSDKILQLTKGKTVVFTGNTGVGKSSILNTLGLGIDAKVSDVSEKLGRGRHTTREVTFFKRDDGGLIGDTPGFGNVDIALEKDLNCNNLAQYFAEFKPWASQCRFADCTHTGESGCLICERASKGKILKSRYQSYLLMYEALKKRDEYNK